MSKSNSEKFILRDKIFNALLGVNNYFLMFVIAIVFLSLLISSLPSIKEYGIGFFFSKEWNPITEEYGALPFIFGTLATSILALLISIPFSLAIAIFLGEMSQKGKIPKLMQSLIEVMSGIPSVIYGFWGIFFLTPIIIKFQEWALQQPMFKDWEFIANGYGILTSSIILAIMIIPYSASIAREVISMVPSGIKDAGYSLGSTRFEVIRKIVIPYAGSGIIAGVLLSFGRALGETMAVTMLIGNSPKLPKNIFSLSDSMASKIANEFGEADGLLFSSLFEIGLTLFAISFVINIIGRLIILKMEHKVQ